MTSPTPDQAARDGREGKHRAVAGTPDLSRNDQAAVALCGSQVGNLALSVGLE